jgi:hypothetical protein
MEKLSKIARLISRIRYPQFELDPPIALRASQKSVMISFELFAKSHTLKQLLWQSYLLFRPHLFGIGKFFLFYCVQVSRELKAHHFTPPRKYVYVIHSQIHQSFSFKQYAWYYADSY